MANTTNYNWETPDDSDLVKDGAAAMRTLGSSIDTTVKALNPETTLGDISYRSSTSNTNTRLAIGSSGQVLTVNGGVPAWASPSSGSLTQLATGSLSGASVTISSISGNYKHLQLIIRDAIPTTSAGLRLRFNSDSGGNYMNFDTTSSGISQTFSETYATISSDIDTTSNTLCVAQIWDYANTDTMKLSNALCISQNSATPNYNLKEGRSAWNNTAAITSITIMYYTGNHNGGTYYLYGVN